MNNSYYGIIIVHEGVCTRFHEGIASYFFFYMKTACFLAGLAQFHEGIIFTASEYLNM